LTGVDHLPECHLLVDLKRQKHHLFLPYLSESDRVWMDYGIPSELPAASTFDVDFL
jgi:hypothetical protein